MCAIVKMSAVEPIPEYIVQQLDKIATNHGFTEYKLDQEAGSKHGDGFVGTLIKVTVSGSRKVNDDVKSDQLHLICKVLPANEARRGLFSTPKAFGREVYMYTRLLPLFKQFQLDKGFAEDEGFFEYPHCYYAISDAAKEQHVLIMDDLRPKGYSLWDKSIPISYDCVKVLMRALGRYHAISYAFRDQKPDIFKEFKQLDDVMTGLFKESPLLEEVINSIFDVPVKMYGDDTPDGKLLQTIRNTYKAVLNECFELGVAEPFSVAGHGDCWINNLMFFGKDTSTPKISFLDWQESRYGSPVLDLTYFFMSSTTKPLRDQHFNEFLQIYYSSLEASLKKCGSDPEELFTFNDMQEQFKRFGKYGLMCAPMLLQVIVPDPKDIAQLDSYADNVEEGSTQDFVTFDEKTEVAYKARLSDVINDAIEYGWYKR